MAHYKTWYFNARRQSEVIRLIFAASGVYYEDFRFGHIDWPKYKPKTVFRKVPMFEIKDPLTNDVKVLAQSNASCRYLANEFNLNGKNNFEKAETDMYIDHLKDVFFALVKIYSETNLDVQNKQFNSFFNETVRNFTQSLESRLNLNNTEYLVGNYLTWLDLAIVGSWDWIWLHDPAESIILSVFKSLNQHNVTVRSIPNIAKWLESRPKTVR
jgi:prostaglandin-H2 D-isomerase / glutathione transferase